MPHSMAAKILPSWRLTDHVCRVCFGRVLERWEQRVHIVRCANCGTEQQAVPVSTLCCCGLKTRSGHDAGLRCQRNENPTPEQPAELAVIFGEARTRATRAPNLKRLASQPSLMLE